MEARMRILTLLALAAAAVSGAPLSGASLAHALREGGYVLVMRHADAPQAPDAAHAAPGNTALERQLNAAGKADARVIGEGLHRLSAPIATVLSSPAFRARQTLRLEGFARPQIVPELAEAGPDMSAAGRGDRPAWLKRRVAELPVRGGNTLIVTHTPNILGAFGDAAAAVAPGEVLVFGRDRSGAPALLARIKPGDWPALGAR
jgi:phosphohistidine phosphatase SixA